MSPASSGTLEVERYIGQCLISSHNRPKPGSVKPVPARDHVYHRDHYVSELYHGSYVNVNSRYRIQRCNSVEGWAGGMPLISFTNNRRGRRLESNETSRSSSPRIVDDSPLARLAFHAQGAPLVLTGRVSNKKGKSLKSAAAVKGQDGDQKSNSKGGSSKESQTVNSGTDAVSVTSDESSGSANSENCLPRIIKPRKRRKKDRKPPHLGLPMSSDGFSTDSASPDIIDSPPSIITLRPYVPFNYDFKVPDCPIINNRSVLTDRYQQYDTSSEAPKLHHSFEDVEEVVDIKDVNGNQAESICQCRYCDPAGLIWNVDRNCYSPYLTKPVPSNQSIKFSSTSDSGSFRKQDESSVINNTSFCLIHGLSSFSLNEDCGQIKSASTGDLEVSTEIVTSPNGHRDLEIKFFSSSAVENGRSRKGSGNLTASFHRRSFDRLAPDSSSAELCPCNERLKLVSEE